jgi:hypothetical protein
MEEKKRLLKEQKDREKEEAQVRAIVFFYLAWRTSDIVNFRIALVY